LDGEVSAMTDTFFTLSADSQMQGAPWMNGAGWSNPIERCAVCRATIGFPSGRIELCPDPQKGSFWPDALGNGGGMVGTCFSVAVKEAFDELGFRYGEAVPATVMPPYPKRIKEKPPAYFYLTGELGAEFDFEGSGHRIKLICSACGVVKKDPLARPVRHRFVPGTWNGSDLFYTALSRNALFCTHRVLELAGQRKWRGFFFSPLDRAYDASFRGIAYC
jgi:hypothetical protein